MQSKKVLSCAMATIIALQGGGIVFASDNNDYIAKEFARINAKYNIKFSPVEGFDYNSLTLDKIKHSIETLEAGLQSNKNNENKITEVKVLSLKENEKENYLKNRLSELNAKYKTNISPVKNFDYNVLSIEQIDDALKSLEENLISNQNMLKNNIANVSICENSNGNISLPKNTIWSELPTAFIYLTGAVNYTAEHDKSLGDIFKSIDSVNTWTVADWELFVSHNWEQKNFRSNIYNRGKRAQVDITGILSASYILKELPLHFEQEINYSYDLNF